MGMTLRKSLVFEIAKEKTNNIFMPSKHYFKARFGII